MPSSDNPQLEFEFIANDKAVDKALTDIEKRAAKTQKKIDEATDAGGKPTNLINTKEILGEIGDTVEGITGRFGKMGVALATVAAAGYTVKKALDFTVEGQQILNIRNGFDRLANSLGADGASLRAQLEEASGGLAGMEAVLQSSQVGLTEFGNGVQRLPELLMVARQAALQFGGTVEDRYKQLVDSVASGNTKALRSIGLFVDVSSELDKYAKAAGRGKDELTQLGERQAILNAVLERSKTVYAGVNADTDNVITASTRLSEAYKNAGDAIKTYMAESFGPGFTAALNGVTSLFKATEGEAKKPVNALAQLDEQIKKTQANMKSLLDELAAEGKPIMDNGVMRQARDFQTLTTQITAAGQALSKLQAQRAAAVEKTKTKTGAGGTEGDGLFNDEVRRAALLEGEKSFQAQMLQIKQAADSADFTRRQLGATLEEAEAVRREQAEAEHQARLDTLRVQFSDRKKYSEMQVNALVEAENIRHQNAMELIDSEGWEKRRELQAKKSEDMQKIESSLQTGLLNVVTSSFDFIAKSLDKGWGSWNEFGGQILNILGSLAIQVGIIISGMGTAINALATSLASFNGAGAVAAGVALIGLGIALKALASGMGASTSSAGTLSDSTTGAPAGGSDTSFIPPEDIEPEGPKMEVNVTVGNVMGTTDRSLALALSELLTDQFSSQGLVIKGA